MILNQFCLRYLKLRCHTVEKNMLSNNRRSEVHFCLLKVKTFLLFLELVQAFY